MAKREQKMKPLFYTLKQVCDQLVLSKQRVVNRYIKKKILKASKTSGETGSYRIHRDEFDRFLREDYIPGEVKEDA